MPAQRKPVAASDVTRARFASVLQAAKLADVSPQTIYVACLKADLRYEWVVDRVFIERASLDRWIAKREARELEPAVSR